MRKARERKRRAGFCLHQRWVDAAPQVYSDHSASMPGALRCIAWSPENCWRTPALIVQARNTLARWRVQAAEPVPEYFLEWARVLEGSPEGIAAFLASMREDATRLRQSSPFTNLLTAEERSRIYEAFQ